MIFYVGFEVPTAVSTKMAVFWVVVYQTTRHYNPEDSHLHNFLFLQIEDTQVYQFEYYEMDLISVN
jgi:hypothetical protein